MAFLVPSFLWALLALAIPIAIHLFQLRRSKRISFSDVRALEEVTKRTRARQRVRHWATLAARMLAITALVLAFAGPYLPGAGGTVTAGERGISLYLDDSWSMDGTNANGRLLDQARGHAQDLVMAHAPTDRFQVLTNRFEGRQQVLSGRDEALRSISQVEVGPYSRVLSQVMQRQREALVRGSAPVKRAFLFTDLQRSTTDPDQWTDDSTVTTVIVPLPAQGLPNLSVDSAWFSTPVRRLGQVEELHVRIRNHGDQALSGIPLKLTVDGRQRALVSIGVGPATSVDTVVHFTNDATGPHHGMLSITDSPITFDDRLHIAYTTTASLSVLVVSGGDARSDADLSAVFRGDSLHRVSVQPYRQLDLAVLEGTDLLILNALPELPSGLADAVLAYCRAGGSVALFPAMGSTPERYSGLLQRAGAAYGAVDTSSTKVERMDLAEPFYRDIFTTMPRNVDLPVVRERMALRVPPAAKSLLQLRNGAPFLADVPVDEGRIYLCAAPLAPGGGNFTEHALFVTSLLRMAELSGAMGPLYHGIGTGAGIPLREAPPRSESPLHLRGNDGVDLIPEVRRTLNSATLVLHDEDLPPGPYSLTLGDDTLATLALNLPRGEGDLSAYTAEELRNAIAQRGLSTIAVLDRSGQQLTQALHDLDQGTKLWKWFIVAALLFLALEIFFIRTAR